MLVVFGKIESGQVVHKEIYNMVSLVWKPYRWFFSPTYWNINTLFLFLIFYKCHMYCLWWIIPRQHEFACILESSKARPNFHQTLPNQLILRVNLIPSPLDVMFITPNSSPPTVPDGVWTFTPVCITIFKI